MCFERLNEILEYNRPFAKFEQADKAQIKGFANEGFSEKNNLFAFMRPKKRFSLR